MKAFLLAAGEGTRLRPLTDSIPKCLVPIRQKPLLEIWLQLCARSGIREVLINLHSHADAVRSFVAGRDFGVQIRLFEEPRLLGSAGTIAANRAWVQPDPYFWVFYADVLTNMNLSKDAPSASGTELSGDAGRLSSAESIAMWHCEIG
jgi:mannose-1-phosphate guanylyltransferase